MLFALEIFYKKIKHFCAKALDKHESIVYNLQGVKKNTLQYIEVTMAEKNLEISVLCDIYSALLPEKQRLALEYYYDDDLSLSEIAEHVGISRQGVRDQIKHAEAQLLALENALHLYEKSLKTEKILDKLLELSQETDNKRLSSLIEELKAVHE